MEVIGTPFVCDGVTKQVGTLTNLSPSEQVVFTSEQTSNLRSGTADESGALDLNWACEPIDDGRTWTITATGAQSGRSGVFSVSGVAPQAEDIEPLTVVVNEEPFVCDGGTRVFATVSNLAPDETVDFSSPDSEGLIDSTADTNGAKNLRWQCDPEDAGKVWQLTVLGVSSRRTTTLTITGAAPAQAPSGDLALSITEEPFACDGQSRAFATISNLAPGELVDFTSPQSSSLRQGQADSDGSLPVRWQCEATEAGTVWELTATGVTSGKTLTFQFAGGAPASP